PDQPRRECDRSRNWNRPGRRAGRELLDERWQWKRPDVRCGGWPGGRRPRGAWRRKRAGKRWNWPWRTERGRDLRDSGRADEVWERWDRSRWSGRGRRFPGANGGVAGARAGHVEAGAREPGRTSAQYEARRFRDCAVG